MELECQQPVNLYAVDAPARKPSALAVWIALYEQDKSDQREQAEAMSRAAEEYLFLLHIAILAL
nr:hypothetical protein [Klebsiella pneumoniae subsp. pneumoniae]